MMSSGRSTSAFGDASPGRGGLGSLDRTDSRVGPARPLRPGREVGPGLEARTAAGWARSGDEAGNRPDAGPLIAQAARLQPGDDRLEGKCAMPEAIETGQGNARAIMLAIVGERDAGIDAGAHAQPSLNRVGRVEDPAHARASVGCPLPDQDS